MLRAEVKVIGAVKWMMIEAVFRLKPDHPPARRRINLQLRQRQQQPLPDSNDVDAMQDELPPTGNDAHTLPLQHPPLRDVRPKRPSRDRNRQRERIPPPPFQPLGCAKCD